MKVLLNLRFVGTAYNGYQVQKQRPTVQRELNLATRALFGYECDVVGCSRTDAGVHAKMFCVAVNKHGQSDLPITMNVKDIPRALSYYLPPDISVMQACSVPDTFHPRYDVEEKEYEYRFLFSPVRDPFEEYRSWHIPGVPLPDALTRMQAAAAAWCGRQDFSSYMAQGSKIMDAVRTVRHTSVERESDIVTFRVSADGFLYHMVRIMAGTLFEVAVGKTDPQEIPTITAARDRAFAGRTAPPHGLYLSRVRYGMALFS